MEPARTDTYKTAALRIQTAMTILFAQMIPASITDALMRK
jgi:hypothetical protein